MSYSEPLIEEAARRWIDFVLTPSSKMSEKEFDSGFELNILAVDNPKYAFEIILKIFEFIDELVLIFADGL